MRHSVTIRISIRVVALLIITASTDMFCEGQHYMASEIWSNYCPGSTDAIAALPVKSINSCGVQCSMSPQCTTFSFYSSSGNCYLYRFLPSRVYFNAHCRVMMDTNAFCGYSAKALAQRDEDLCNNPLKRAKEEDYFGCLSLTSIVSYAGAQTICLAPPDESVGIQLKNVDLGSGPVPLPFILNWIIVMQRFDGESLNFNRGWIEYRNGFGNHGLGDFWLGNEKVHRLTNQAPYRLHIEVQLSTTGKWYYADYSTFSIDSENQNYAIHVAGFSGVAGDSLSNKTIPPDKTHNGMSFSTPDVDNDGTSNVTPCAVFHSSGWWFNACGWSCLTCTSNGYVNMIWASLEPQGQLRAARMMITRA